MAYTPYVWHDGDTGGTLVTAARLNALEQGLSAASSRGVAVEDYYLDSDAGDYGPALTRALAAATPQGQPVILSRVYPVASTVALNSGDSIAGYGPATGLRGPLNAPVTILQAVSRTGITLTGFLVDGNAVALTAAVSIRTVEFVSCTDVTVRGLTVRHTPEWGLTFKLCNSVAVFDHVHDIGNDTLSGSRDGVHFLDTSDAVLDGAVIHSGDDCVAITSETRDIDRVTVRNVTGHSNIAAVVTVGNEGSTAFTTSDITVEGISTFQPTNRGSTPPTYIVKIRAQNNSLVQRVRVANVTGSAFSHAVWLDGNSVANITDVEVAGLNVTSTTNHGVLFNYVRHFELHSVRAKSTAGLYDGVNLTQSRYGAVSGSARNCALWGLQLNGCISLDVVGFIARENGAVNFSTNTGGNGRIVNCIDIQVIGGQYVGAATTSYYGISQAGNTTVVISTATRIGGAN